MILLRAELIPFDICLNNIGLDKTVFFFTSKTTTKKPQEKKTSNK